MYKGQIAHVVEKVYDGLSRIKGDIDRNLALRLAEQEVPNSLDAKTIVDRLELARGSELYKRAYFQ